MAAVGASGTSLARHLFTDADPHEFYFALCILNAKRSKDPCTQVGACVVNEDNQLLGTGYNGMPRGCHDDVFPWAKHRDDPLDNKHLYVCHAELNAIVNSVCDLTDCKIYVTLFPCNECTKLIIQSGITEIIYLDDKHCHKTQTVASKLMLQSAKVKYWQYKFSSKFSVDLVNFQVKRIDENHPEVLAKTMEHLALNKSG